MVDIFTELNKTQLEAVQHTEGPSLIIAGAGSGKTRVLTYRISWLLSNGVPASSVLALTFTNKAAREMKERIQNLVGDDRARYLWMGTFHSMFARILRNEGHLLGYPSSFTIYDTTDSKNLVKTIIREMQLDEKMYKPGEVFHRISTAKNALITPQAYGGITELISFDQSTRREKIIDIYKKYASRCLKAGAMDFDDLLLNTNILFRDFPDILDKYQQKFHFILVDEYQDTNLAQYMILKKLSENHRNICVVGDDAQSIYAFRGARIENILNFRNDYPEARVYKLERNYRSTQNIVEAANSLIEKNSEKLSKKVFSKNDLGEKIRVVHAATDTEEGFLVANAIFDEHLQEQVHYREFAILYRTNAQSRIFEEALRKRNIPYKVYGSVSFYQRKEIKDVLAYLRLIVNPRDDESLKRIINFPARGIGKTTLDKLEAAALQSGKNLWYVITHPGEFDLRINSGLQKRISGFVQLISGSMDKRNQMDAYELAYEVTKKAGILNLMQQSSAPEEISRYENIQELLNGISEFIAEPEQEGRFVSLDEYLQNVSLLTDLDTDTEESDDSVKIMTAHSAKGLEFSHVFIAGVEENLFPSQLSNSTQRELEEERRLFYVALTRAKKRVTISWARSRFRWGSTISCNPSRFIDEINPEFLDLPSGQITPRNGAFDTIPNPEYTTSSGSQKTTVNFRPRQRSRFRPVNDHRPAPNPHTDFKSDDPAEIFPGQRVEHALFGEGKVLHVEGNLQDRKATVFFKDHGQKQLLLKFARLKIIRQHDKE
ncbi:MAG: UvrD-helicase domain-containing protein [Chlorobi bacterium]|nr:UvrD-helicase domain-containing protein [Chlorobiota bacterium]